MSVLELISTALALVVTICQWITPAVKRVLGNIKKRVQGTERMLRGLHAMFQKHQTLSAANLAQLDLAQAQLEGYVNQIKSIKAQSVVSSG